jgi:hypothetical protein
MGADVRGVRRVGRGTELGARGLTGSRSMRPLAQVRFMVRGSPLRQMAVRLLSGRRAASFGKGSGDGFCVGPWFASGTAGSVALADNAVRSRSMVLQTDTRCLVEVNRIVGATTPCMLCLPACLHVCMRVPATAAAALLSIGCPVAAGAARMMQSVGVCCSARSSRLVAPSRTRRRGGAYGRR